MNELTQNIFIGTASMLTIVMCIMVIVFVFMIFRDHRYINARQLYKDWILFTGISMTFTSLIFEVFVPHIFSNNGFLPDQIRLLLIYNNFVRFIGISFVFIWVIFFQAFVLGEKLDTWFQRKKPKSIK